MIYLITILVILLVTLYFYLTKNFNYWKNRGIKHDKPVPLFGTDTDMYLFKKSWTQHLSDLYNKYPSEKVVGTFRSSTPELIIRDPDIIKRILITDFSHFHLRALLPSEEPTEPLLQHLFGADGDLWKLVRQRLTPAFTTGKLKAMFPLIVERAERLHLRIQAADETPIDSKDLMARFTTDFIGACGFGLDMDALSDEDSEFRKLGKKIINFSIWQIIRGLLKQLPFKIFKKIRYTASIEADMLSLVSSILKGRNYEPSGRNDFVDLLLQCKQKGTMVGESIEKFKPDGTPEMASLEMTEGLMAAQMFVFFAAGFETSSSTTSYTLHLLAYHPEKQKKVQENILQALAKYDNKLCYDAIKEMHYLEWAFKESMRIFPSVGFLLRQCAHPYKVPEINLTIEAGIKVYVPVAAMQNDPKYFKNPEEFRPERFSPEELDVEATKFAYLPFGDGPRGCIGERLGLMQSLAGLAAVLSRFTVEPAPNSLRHPVVVNRPSLIQLVEGGLPLVFKKIQI